jgi:methylmalonyl-CoA mutase N-terminal domain/subunit
MIEVTDRRGLTDARATTSGIEIAPVYRADPAFVPAPDPGEYPYTRGIYRDMYRGRLWTMRQYAGFASAEETNRRFRLLLERGQTGLSVAFDLPTQLGLDADDPRSEAEVGLVGVSISTVDDMRRLFDGIDLGRATTSMTINAPASILLLMYQIVAEEQGVAPEKIGGTIQNDILKEYCARGTYIFPPRPSMRLVTDTFSYCAERLPSWNTISISGYHIREAGSSAVQEVAFTLANGIAFVRAALDAGLDVDAFAPRLSFFFNAHSHFLEEVAKFRAARRMWAKIMAERFEARNPRSMMLRFHTQTAGSTLTAQQPLNNVVRVALQGLSAVFGGTQSLHTNGYDEALALPTAEAATLALRTQQIIAYESGVADTADPFAGSYVVEALTDEIERRAFALIDEIERMGGAVAAIESGYIQQQIAESAYAWEQAVEAGERRIVGVNFQRDEAAAPVPLHHIDRERVQAQIERTRAYKLHRDPEPVARALAGVRLAAMGTENLLPRIREALLARATLGEICDTLRDVWGEYRPNQ